MIVGEGRAGKTALVRALQGEPFADTRSTVGIDTFTMDVKQVKQAGEGSQWAKHTPLEHQFEAQIAKFAAQVAAPPAPAPAPSVQTVNTREPNAGTPPPVSQQPASQPAAGALTPTAPVAEVPAQAAGAPVAAPLAPLDAAAVDTGLVARHMADVASSGDASIVFSIFDFGGQDVFRVIHPFFLTHTGVYLAIFNMVDLLAPSSRAACLGNIVAWVNTVVAHTTRTEEGGKPAPVALVGIHGDLVSAAQERAELSSILHEALHLHAAWPTVILPPTAPGYMAPTAPAYVAQQLCFFPVDCTMRGPIDPSVRALMASIEKEVDASAYVNELKPLGWFKVLDSVTGCGKSAVPHTRVAALAAESGVPEREVDAMLRFFHQLGSLMWHDEEGLRDTIIVDPIAYFVAPSTRVVCCHDADGVGTQHHADSEPHKLARKNMAAEFKDMAERGILTDGLLRALFSDQGERFAPVRQLMAKYALIVPLEDGASGAGAGKAAAGQQPRPSDDERVRKYVVPALLPSIPAARPKGAATDAVHEFRFLLGLASVWDAAVTTEEMRGKGFLPPGIFQRFLAKAIAWSIATSCGATNASKLALHKEGATLHFGVQEFTLALVAQENSIVVRSVGATAPTALLMRLEGLLKACIKECAMSLTVTPLLPYLSQGGPADGETALCHLQHGLISQAVLFGQPIHVAVAPPPGETQGTTRPVSKSALIAQYGGWLDPAVRGDPSVPYDVFISYRWLSDKANATKLRDVIGSHPLTESGNRLVRVFQDDTGLAKGDAFLRKLCGVLTGSAVALPIVSSGALERMTSGPQHDPTAVDNLLFEWVIMAVCTELKHRLRTIPIFIGDTHSSAAAGGEGAAHHLTRAPFFDRNGCYNFTQLSTAVPKATLDAALGLLQEIGILRPEQRLVFAQWSIRDVVERLRGLIGLDAHNYNSELDFITAVSRASVAAVTSAAPTVSLSPGAPAAIASLGSPAGFNPASPSAVTADALGSSSTGAGTPVSAVTAYETAWQCVQDPLSNPRVLKESAQVLHALMEEEGVYELEDLANVDADVLCRMAACLKPAQMRKFSAAMRLTGPS